MSDYHLVSTLHAARVTLADARKAGDAAAAAAAEAQVAAARAAVDAALADGRVTSAAHLLDLDFDCLGAILSLLGPRDALATAHTCTTLRSALFRGGLPGPLAVVCRRWWGCYTETEATKAAILRALDETEPALGARRLDFDFYSFDEGHARVLARALDVAPRASQINITLKSVYFYGTDVARLADVLSSPDRSFASPPQVHVMEHSDDCIDKLQRLTSTCVASIEELVHRPDAFSAWIAANTLTELRVKIFHPLNLTTRFPALRRLIVETDFPERFTTDVPSLTAMAPLLKEVEFVDSRHHMRDVLRKHGFGFEPPLFARFVAAIQGVTRICIPQLGVTLSHNENENLRQLTALSTLRDLEILYRQVWVLFGPLSSRQGPTRAPVAADVISNLPPLAPGLTRLAFSYAARVTFGHPLPELRVLDWRNSDAKASCTSFYSEEGEIVVTQDHIERHLRVPLAIPSAAIAPNLHTLLIGFEVFKPGWEEIKLPRGKFNLWTLVAARTALRVVVIEHARLFCSAPAGFDTTAAGFAALMAREAKDLLSVHTHGCEIEGGHQPAVETFLRAVEQRGGRTCRAGIEECVFCMLHDGTMDFWPR